MDNYEEKYKSALKWMQSLYGGLHGATKEEAEKYFPELKESKDELTWLKTFIEEEAYCQSMDIRDEADRKRLIKLQNALAWLEKQEEPKDKGEISDGYHTFNELYRYRLLYNAAFFNLLPKELVHKSKRHHDGEECFGGGWFIVMANLPTGQISNHYELKDWDLFQIPEKDVADKWDGHTPQEAADRLHKYLLEKQDKQPTDKVEYPRWISVKDELPNLFDDVLYCDKYGDYYTETDNIGEDVEITHWIRIPDCPPLQDYNNKFKTVLDGENKEGGEQ